MWIMLTLWQPKNTESGVDCDRKSNIGLRHLALRAVDVNLDPPL
jgi:hypothetical protein